MRLGVPDGSARTCEDDIPTGGAVGVMLVFFRVLHSMLLRGNIRVALPPSSVCENFARTLDCHVKSWKMGRNRNATSLFAPDTHLGGRGPRRAAAERAIAPPREVCRRPSRGTRSLSQGLWSRDPTTNY